MVDTNDFQEIIDSFYKELLKTEEKITNKRLAADKWSLREIIGHLIDSASNNHQRFVRLQFGDLLDFPPYGAEEWISVQEYNSMGWDNLVALWYNYNCLLLHIVKNSHEMALQNVWVQDENTFPLEILINEYYKHLEQHIKHFLKRREEIIQRTT